MQEERKKRQKTFRKGRENIVTEERLRCENIESGNHIYHSWTLCQFYTSCQKRGYHLSGELWWFFLRYRKILPKSMHQIAQIRFETCKVFIASEGAHPTQTPPFQTRKICKVFTDYIQTIFLHVSITNSRNAGHTKIWMPFLNFLRQFASR